jgi:hypothetical protein
VPTADLALSRCWKIERLLTDSENAGDWLALAKRLESLMTADCIHVPQIRDVTPSALGCEECLKVGHPGFICGYVAPAVMSAVAILRQTSMQPNVSAQPVIRSLKATIRQKVGAGVMLINNLLTSPGVRRRITVQFLDLLIEDKPIVLAFIHVSETGKSRHARRTI